MQHAKNFCEQPILKFDRRDVMTHGERHRPSEPLGFERHRCRVGMHHLNVGVHHSLGEGGGQLRIELDRGQPVEHWSQQLGRHPRTGTDLQDVGTKVRPVEVPEREREDQLGEHLSPAIRSEQLHVVAVHESKVPASYRAKGMPNANAWRRDRCALRMGVQGLSRMPRQARVRTVVHRRETPAFRSCRMTDAIEVVLVEAPACHLCQDAADALEKLGRERPVLVRRVDIGSAEGRAIVRRHRAPMPPVVLVDGQLLGWGRLSRGKLRRRLDDLAMVRAGE